MPKRKPYDTTAELPPPKTERGMVKTPVGLEEVRDPSAGLKAKDLAPFTRLDGEYMPAQEAWGALPYAELQPMFLDQFLIRYFCDLIKTPTGDRMDTLGPWDAFCQVNPWAMGMRSLFWQLTGYELSTRQLNAAIEEYVERVGKFSKPGVPARTDALTPEVVEHHGE